MDIDNEIIVLAVPQQYTPPAEQLACGYAGNTVYMQVRSGGGAFEARFTEALLSVFTILFYRVGI